jgi:hypothetical protein
MERADHAALPAVLPPDHPTTTVFLDETGVVHHAHDRYFGIGCLIVRDAARLLRAIGDLRDRTGYRDELHWADFDKARTLRRPAAVSFAKQAIDLVFDATDVQFCCHIADRRNGDLTGRFRRHDYPGHRAYEWLAAEVLHDVIGEREIATVFADQMSTPPGVQFERDVAATVNERRARLAVSTVCRFDSRSTDGLQLVDLLLGAAALDLRQGRTGGDTQKQAILEHLLDRCGFASFRPHGRSREGKLKVVVLAKRRRARRGRRGG